jgi:hypothetical protein
MIYLNPNDYSVVDADLPNAIPLLASWQGGRILMMGRATSRTVLHNTLIAAKLMFLDLVTGQITYGREVDAVEEQPYAYDPRVAPMPRIVLTPGTYDEEGNELTAPTFDSRYHANILLGPDIVARGTWKEPLLNYYHNGALVGEKNADEVAYTVGGVELIDPDTIRSPSNMWG